MQVRFSAKHLLRIITDILDFSKIEAGKLEMEDIQFSLYDQLEHAVSVLAARANKKGLELACQVDHTVPDQIIGDPGRLFQVFVNLIGNVCPNLYMVNIITYFSTPSKHSREWYQIPVKTFFGLNSAVLELWRRDQLPHAKILHN